MTDPQSVPVSGEQHERAVEAAIHGHASYSSNIGIQRAIDAYFASLREQGVCLVDLREVADELQATPGLHEGHVFADAIERRFGGNERSES